MNKYPATQRNQIRDDSGSIVYTIPRDLARELDLEPGESPSEIKWDGERREISLSF